jgi:Acetyltransferase (GNAT) domain
MFSGASTASARGPSGTSRAAASSAASELRLAGDGIEGIAPGEVEAGWWVTEDRRGDGIATEAMEAAIDDLFSHTDVETITAYISDGGNEASRRVAAKLGFSVRGRGRGRSGEPMTVYTLPRDDWLRRRTRPALGVRMISPRRVFGNDPLAGI